MKAALLTPSGAEERAVEGGEGAVPLGGGEPHQGW